MVRRTERVASLVLIDSHSCTGNVGDMVGQSNAANPSYAGLVYDPIGTGKNRWQNLPASKIARMYVWLIQDVHLLIAA